MSDRTRKDVAVTAAVLSLACLLVPVSPVAAEEIAEEDQGPALPLSDRFRPVYEGRIYLVRVNFHQPRQGGHPAPWIDDRGWHARDIKRPVIFGAGEQVMVTGVFDYGDRSLFLELSRWPFEPWSEEPRRVRVRVRVKAESGPEEPREQEEQIRLLVGLFLRRPSP